MSQNSCLSTSASQAFEDGCHVFPRSLGPPAECTSFPQPSWASTDEDVAFSVCAVLIPLLSNQPPLSMSFYVVDVWGSQVFGKHRGTELNRISQRRQWAPVDCVSWKGMGSCHHRIVPLDPVENINMLRSAKCRISATCCSGTENISFFFFFLTFWKYLCYLHYYKFI